MDAFKYFNLKLTVLKRGSFLYTLFETAEENETRNTLLDIQTLK